ncbi:MAG TPA: glycosyltransferase family 2 protein [Solirubrobacteraceae bacterium]|nr:glycosyltransferase family 2 protein [Solirubrobacteraceae bacterium]
MPSTPEQTSDVPVAVGQSSGEQMAPGQPRPDVSVIVVNYRSTELTGRALEQAARSAGQLTLQQIVVDVDSPPDQLALLRELCPHAQIVELHSNRGFAAGNNAGIPHARGRHLLLLNPDAFAEHDAVEALVRRLDADPRVGLVAPLLLNEDGSSQDNVHSRFPNLLTLFVDFCAPLAFLVRGTRLDPHNIPRSRLTEPRPIAHAIGAVLLVRAEAAAAAGPLDEGFFLYLEETEWQRRIAAAGWAREVLPAARFVHLGGASTGGFPLASPHYIASVRRYYPRPRLALAVIWAAALISFFTLRIATALGRGSPRTRQLADAFGDLLKLLLLSRARRARAPRA